MTEPIKTKIADIPIGPLRRVGRPLNIQHMAPGAPPRLTVLIYGASGGGKTHFAGTFPKPFFIDCQGGMLTLRKQNVAFVQPQDYLELLNCTLPENLEEYQTVVLDTATEAARVIMDATLKLSGHDIAQLQDWQQTIERMRQYMRRLLELPKHVIVTAEEGFNKDEDTGKMTYGPSLPGKLFAEAAALFDCVFHIRGKMDLQSKKVVRSLLTSPEGMYTQAKDRTGVLDHHEVPDFKVIWDKVSKS